jgi:hypothetical protein
LLGNDHHGSVVGGGWGYLACNGSLSSLESVLGVVMRDTKAASDHSDPSNGFETHAELLEMFNGLEAYGYSEDAELKVDFICIRIYVALVLIYLINVLLLIGHFEHCQRFESFGCGRKNRRAFSHCYDGRVQFQFHC